MGRNSKTSNSLLILFVASSDLLFMICVRAKCSTVKVQNVCCTLCEGTELLVGVRGVRSLLIHLVC